jgi:hypothetical protein
MDCFVASLLAMTERILQNPNAVLNIVAVAKRSSDGAKIAACEAQGIETMQAIEFVVARKMRCRWTTPWRSSIWPAAIPCANNCTGISATR